jgi:hypothetical protein
MKKLIIPGLIFASFFYGCDKISTPIPLTDEVETSGISYDTSFVASSNTIRKIVLEEFTGHKCSQCPGGALEIEQLRVTYGTQLIPISIHSGFFAEPEAAGSGIFETDFRTEVGEALNTFGPYAPAGYPAGMVSRFEYNGNITNGKSTWDIIIQQIQNNTPKVKIGITSLYNDSLRIIKEVIQTEWLRTEPNNYKLQVYLLEDVITDWQKDGSTDIANYIHKHVLRKSLNSNFGTAIPSAVINAIDEQEFTFEIPLEWNVDN